MTEDGWSGYKEFKADTVLAQRYYDLVRTVFEAGVQRVCQGKQVGSAVDLGCGSGELTRGLRSMAGNVTGVDSSPGLIEQAASDPDQENLEFILADVLDETVVGRLSDGEFDLVSAAWLHNHLGTEEQQRRLIDSILRLLKPDGRIVFLIPGIGFTTPKAQRFIARLDWHQGWLEETPNNIRGVYRFGNSPWQEMWVWEPLWLARLYQPHFQLEFMDVKGMSIEHDGLGEEPLEPPFEVLVGWRR